ncbi:MAG: efflux RND transporter periplasmic adaptor subunit [Ignavibacteria bacterium]
MENNNNVDLSSLVIDKSKKESFNGTGKTKKAIYISVTVAIVAVAAFLIFLPGALTPSVEVKTTSAFIQSSSQSNGVLTASGYIVAQRKAAVASKGTGRLGYLGVVEGDKVKKNQIIARLEDSDFRAMVDEADASVRLNEADLKESQNILKRQGELLKAGAGTQAEYESAETRYYKVLSSIRFAKAQLATANVNLENTLIRAPFNGTVLTKNADVGEIVAPLAGGANSKSAVVTIADMSSLQAEVDVSEANIEKITIGMDCEISLDAYPSVRYQGYVAKIVPTADRSKGTVMIKVAFKDYDQKVLPEMSTKVLFLKTTEKKTEQPALVVPATALITVNGKTAVYKIVDGKAIETPVVTGREMGSFVEIKQGITEGEQVIDNLNDNIKNNAKVTIK